MSDRVLVNNLCITGRVGVSDAERQLDQQLFVDIDARVVRSASNLDLLEDTVCYGELCDLAKRLAAETPCQLIETLAHRLADAILAQHDKVLSVRVQIRKPFAPLAHTFDAVGVEVEHHRHG